MQARDVMTTSVESVKPDTTVYDVARLMAAKRISGVPVVDESGQVVGMITEGDLLRANRPGSRRTRSRRRPPLF
jgi:CBS domain-containing protein